MRSALAFVILLAMAPFAGCLQEDHGPLMFRLVDYQVHDPRNVTVTIAYENTGRHPIEKIDADINAFVWDGREWITKTRHGYEPVAPWWTPDEVEAANHSPQPKEHDFRSGISGRWPIESPKADKGIFNWSEVIEPSETRVFNISIYYPPEQAGVYPWSVYTIYQTAEYSYDGDRVRVSYDFPCFTVRGDPFPYHECDEWVWKAQYW